jgi:hypothetical protein
MSIEYTMRAVCDQCGTEIEPPTPVKKTDIDSLRWDWQHKWKRSGVMQGLPNNHGKYKLYCAECAGA